MVQTLAFPNYLAGLTKTTSGTTLTTGLRPLV
jgi:hypothetical protein